MIPLSELSKQEPAQIGDPEPKIRKLSDIVGETQETYEEYKKRKEKIAPEYKSPLGVRYRGGLSDSLRQMTYMDEGIKIMYGQAKMAVGGMLGKQETVERGRSLIQTMNRDIDQQEREAYEKRPLLSAEDMKSFGYMLGGGTANYGVMITGAYLTGGLSKLAGLSTKVAVGAAEATGLGENFIMEATGRLNQSLEWYKQRFNDPELKTLTPEVAGKNLAWNLIYATGSTILEKKFGFGEQVKLVKTPLLSAGKRVLMTSASEGGTEFVQGLLNIGIDLAEGQINWSKVPDEIKGAFMEGSVGAVLGGTAGIAAATAHRSTAKNAIKEYVKPFVPEDKLDVVADAIYESGNDSMSNVIAVELAQSSELRAKRGAVYDSFVNASLQAMKDSGGYQGMSEDELGQLAVENANMFADQVLAEAHKRGVVVDDVIKASDIVYDPETKELRLAPMSVSEEQQKVRERKRKKKSPEEVKVKTDELKAQIEENAPAEEKEQNLNDVVSSYEGAENFDVEAMSTDEKQAVFEAEQQVKDAFAPTQTEETTPQEELTLEEEPTAEEKAETQAENITEEVKSEQINKEEAETQTELSPETNEAIQENTLPEVEKEDTTTPDKIEDFGEYLYGARKDLWTGFKNKLNETLPEDAVNIKLSEVFPEPNYEKAIANGVDVNALAAIKALRDMIPTKPKREYRLRKWREMVFTMRNIASEIVNNNFDLSVMNDVLSQPKYANINNIVKMYQMLGYPYFTKAKGYAIEPVYYHEWRPGDWTLTNIFHEGDKEGFAVTFNGRYIRINDTYFLENANDGVEEVKRKLDIETKEKDKKVKFDIYYTGNHDKVYVGKKVRSGKYLDLRTFNTVKEAREYLANNYDSLVEELNKLKQNPMDRGEVNEARVGEDYRNGSDATPEMFADMFGFRGVQFGNWVEQKTRIKDLNEAYDALVDLSKVLNIPTRAIALNGTLGLAFGARGHKGALAHYEPDTVVINLTKMKGAGSLAHEWFHALDNSFMKKENKQYEYATEWASEYNPLSHNRPEVMLAFMEVRKAIKNSGLVERAQEWDKWRSADYWSTVREMGARTFEQYVKDKLAEKGVSNDFLVNLISTEDEQNVYLNKDEKSEIYAAYDKLFNTLKTRETEKGVELYQQGRGYVGYSMSVNMADAQAEGRLPASKAAKELGVTTEAIKTVLNPSEWHHASSYYNRVDVYDINPYLALKKGEDLEDLGYDEYEITEFKENWEKMKNVPKPDKTVEQFYGNAEWIEWEGTRKHPKAVEHKEEGIKIEKKGQFYTFYLKNGYTVRKKVDSNGTYVVSEETLAEKQRYEALSKQRNQELNNIAKQYEEQFNEYEKENHLDKPTKETFERFMWDKNQARDNAYIYGQKPYSAEKKKGLRRLHVEKNYWNNDCTDILHDGIIQEWDGEKWNDIEQVKSIKMGEERPMSWVGDIALSKDERYKKLKNAFTSDEIENLLNNEKFYQGENKQGAQKGLFDSKSKVIKLFENADASTLNHELAHYWLDNMWTYAQSGLASEQYKAQLQGVKEFLGVKPEQEFLTRTQHEKFARAYEKYIYRGMIPNSMMGTVFDNYGRFIRKVYDSIEDITHKPGKKLKLTPEIIKFFDSMLTGGVDVTAMNETMVSEARNEEAQKADDETMKEAENLVNAMPEREVMPEIAPVKVEGKTKESRLYERLKGTVGETGTLEYNVANIEEQRKKAKELWQNNPEKAKNILNGTESADDILRQALYTEQQRLALENGDTNTFLNSVRKQSAEATRLGQELSALRGVAEDISDPAYWIRSAENEALKNLAKKQTKNLENAKGNSPLVELTSRLDADIKTLQKEVMSKETNEEKLKALKDGAKSLADKYQGLKQPDTTFNQIDWGNEEFAIDYIENKVKEKLGIALSKESAKAFIQTAKELDTLSKQMDNLGLPTEQFLAKKDELERMRNRHTPTARTKVLISTIGRANMLTAPATSVLNVVSNAQNYILENIVRKVGNIIEGHTNDNIVSENLKDEYRAKVWKTFWDTGYDVSMMTSLLDERIYKGEKGGVSSSEGDGAIRAVGRFAEKWVFSRLISSPDVAFKSVLGFTDYVSNEATQAAYSEGLSGVAAQKRADELFKDAIKIEPETEKGKEIRNKSQAEALILTFQQDTKLSKALVSIREKINESTGDIGIGDILSPFVKTPANIISMGFDASVGAFASPVNLIGALNDLRSGNLKSARVLQAVKQTTTASLAYTVLSLLVSMLIDDDDYIPDYAQLTQSERNAARARNASFGSVKIGDTWVSTDFFGTLEMPLVVLLNTRRTGNLLKGLASGVGSKSLDMPVLRDVIGSSDAIKDIATEKEDIVSLIGENVANASISRLTPNVLNTIAKMIDNKERKANTIADKFASRIPLIRESLPEKINVSTGKAQELGRLNTLLLGARGKTENKNALSKEIGRLADVKQAVNISDPTARGDLSKLSDAQKIEAQDIFAKEYYEKASRLIRKPSYIKKTDEGKKEALNDVKSDIVKNLKRKYRKEIKKVK